MFSQMKYSQSHTCTHYNRHTIILFLQKMNMLLYLSVLLTYPAIQGCSSSYKVKGRQERTLDTENTDEVSQEKSGTLMHLNQEGL